MLLLAKSTTSLSSNASSSVKANSANANQAAALNPSDPNYFGSPYRDGFRYVIFLKFLKRVQTANTNFMK